MLADLSVNDAVDKGRPGFAIAVRPRWHCVLGAMNPPDPDLAAAVLAACEQENVDHMLTDAIAHGLY